MRFYPGLDWAGASHAASATCVCQPEMAELVFANESDSAAARLVLHVPTAALARIPAAATNVEYVLTEMAWSSSMGIATSRRVSNLVSVSASRAEYSGC